MNGRGAALAAGLALLAAGCELAEVTTAGGRDLVVVEAILRAGEERQDVLLHRTLNGEVVRGEPGARVVVRDSAGGEAAFEERPLNLCAERLFPEDTDSLSIEASCYSTQPGRLHVVPGGAYELRVETRDGLVLRGRTRVPGAFALRRPAVTDPLGACALPPRTNLEVVWSRSEDAWSYLVGMQIVGLRSALEGTGIEAPDLLELTGVAVSEEDTLLVVPREVGLFERFDQDQELMRLLQEGFPPGVGVELAVAAADRNFVNGVRGGGFNPSGNVRISSVVGDGVGVFGSLVPLRLFLAVARGEVVLPSCLPDD
jgi:hypothetical protein